MGSKEVEEDGDEDELSAETGDDDQDDQVGNSDYQGLVLDFSSQLKTQENETS